MNYELWINFSSKGGSASGGQFSISNFQIILNFRIFKYLNACHCEERSDEAIPWLILSLRPEVSGRSNPKDEL